MDAKIRTARHRVHDETWQRHPCRHMRRLSHSCQ